MATISIDFETTNIDPAIAHPVEVACFDGEVLYDHLIKPPISIPVETSAIHHITDADVKDCCDWADTIAGLRGYLKDDDVLIAHNAKYEQAVLKDSLTGMNIRWVCTYKCALRIWPEAPNHKNETLRYWLGLPNLGRAYKQQAHSAGHDAIVTYQIFEKLLEKANISRLLDWSALPALLPTIPFGKHRGAKWSQVPTDYLTWLLKQTDMEEDIKYNAKTEMDLRRKNAASRSY